MHVFIALTAPDDVQAALQANGKLGEFRELLDELTEMTVETGGSPTFPMHTRRLVHAIKSAIRDAERHYQRPVVDEPAGTVEGDPEHREAE